MVEPQINLLGQVITMCDEIEWDTAGDQWIKSCAFESISLPLFIYGSKLKYEQYRVRDRGAPMTNLASLFRANKKEAYAKAYEYLAKWGPSGTTQYGGGRRFVRQKVDELRHSGDVDVAKAADQLLGWHERGVNTIGRNCAMLAGRQSSLLWSGVRANYNISEILDGAAKETHGWRCFECDTIYHYHWEAIVCAGVDMVLHRVVWHDGRRDVTVWHRSIPTGGYIHHKCGGAKDRSRGVWSRNTRCMKYTAFSHLVNDGC